MAVKDGKVNFTARALKGVEQSDGVARAEGCKGEGLEREARTLGATSGPQPC